MTKKNTFLQGTKVAKDKNLQRNKADQKEDRSLQRRTQRR